MRFLFLPFIVVFGVALVAHGMEGQAGFYLYNNQPFGKYRYRDGNRESVFFKDDNGDNILHFLSRKGDTEGIRELLRHEKFDHLIFAFNYKKEAPINIAANTEIMRLFLEKAPRVEVKQHSPIDLKKIEQNRKMARDCLNIGHEYDQKPK